MSDSPLAPLRLVYSPRYDIRLLGFERLHPFDSTKYGRAWAEVRQMRGDLPERLCVPPDAAVSDATLLRVHTESYLRSLRSGAYLERALELPYLRYVPSWLRRRAVLEPMRWATAGTLRAAELALEVGAAVNFSGGYHHASPERGEGFCLFADVPVAVAALRAAGTLRAGDRIGVIDLDAHQGNGFARCFADDPTVVLLDVYNGDIYPHDQDARARVDVDVPLRMRTADEEYLAAVRAGLERFFALAGDVRLVFYNAGTDVFELDPLGGLRVSRDGIGERDRMVCQSLTRRDVPFVMVPSGGYTRGSYKLIADSVAWLIDHRTPARSSETHA